jgi:hypothetical protein
MSNINDRCDLTDHFNDRVMRLVPPFRISAIGPERGCSRPMHEIVTMRSR